MHTEALAAALVSFHKSQCYFASAIQIAALVLSQKSFQGLKSASEDGDFEDFLDTAVMNLLATSGFVPVCLVLVCITRYGRQTWYIIILSSVTFPLATATLASSYVFVHRYGKPDDFYGSVGGENVDDTECPLNGDISGILYPLCGSSQLNHNALSSSTVSNVWIWLVWLNCMIWTILCLVKKIIDTPRKMPANERSAMRFITMTRVNPLYSGLSKNRTGMIVFLITAGLCFGAQFALFSVYLRHSFISSAWTFGQIIAVTVWIPSLVEYLYIEYSKWIRDPHFRATSDAGRWDRGSFQTRLSFTIAGDERFSRTICQPGKIGATRGNQRVVNVLLRQMEAIDIYCA